MAAGQARTGWLAAGVHPSQFRILHDSCMTDLHSICIMHVNPDLHELNWGFGGSTCHSDLFLSDSPAKVL